MFQPLKRRENKKRRRGEGRGGGLLLVTHGQTHTDTHAVVNVNRCGHHQFCFFDPL